MSDETVAAHKFLFYLLTRAMANPENLRGGQIKLSYKKLCAAMGKKPEQNVDLLVTIDLEWAEPQEALLDDDDIDENESTVFDKENNQNS